MLRHQWKEELEDILITAWRDSDPYVRVCIDSFLNCGAGYATCGAIAHVISSQEDSRAAWMAANSAQNYLHKLHIKCRSDGSTVYHLGRMPLIVRRRIKKFTGSDDLTK